LKLQLWKQHEHNRDAYTAAKTDFICKWTAEARKEYRDDTDKIAADTPFFGNLGAAIPKVLIEFVTEVNVLTISLFRYEW
jgi:hypothetical protein